MNPIGDSVIRVIEQALAELVKNDFAIVDEVRFESTPGHAPDHLSVHIASTGEEDVIAVDLVHSPVQCLDTDGCPDRTSIRRCRRPRGAPSSQTATVSAPFRALALSSTT